MKISLVYRCSAPMPRLYDAIRDELRALTRDVLALAIKVPFRRVHDDSRGKTVTALVPTDEQRNAASIHHRRLRNWSNMVTSILRRRGRAGATTIAQCTADLEPYVRMSRMDVAGVTEGTWRTAFASQVSRLSVTAARIVDENADAFAMVRRRSMLQHDDFDVRLVDINRVEFDLGVATEALAARDTETISGVGQALFHSVFAGSIGDDYAKRRQAASQAGRGLRLRLHPARSGSLAGVPWELMHDGQQFLALSGETPIVRCIDSAESMWRPPASVPLRILLTISSPRSFPFLDMGAERERLEAAVAPLIMFGMVELDVAPDGSLTTLRRALRSAEEIGRPYHVWHFIGHGRYDEETARGDLVMSGERNEPQYAGGWELGPLFKSHRDLRFACLNACNGALWQVGTPMSGAATSLLQAGVPAVTGMQFPISDPAAITFAEELYGALADGAALEDAVTEARRGIFFQPNPTEWITPVLFVPGNTGNDTPLLAIDQTPE